MRCGRIEEFHDERIEKLQVEAAERLGFRLTGHLLRLTGVCPACVREISAEGRLAEVLGEEV